MTDGKSPELAGESTFDYPIRRRSLLKTAGIGVAGTSIIASDTAAAADGVYDERVELGPFQPRTVKVSDLPEADPPKDPRLQGGQEGSTEEEEFPFFAPGDSSTDHDGVSGKVLSSHNAVLNIEKDFDGLTTLDTVRIQDDPDDFLFVVVADPVIAAGLDHVATCVNLQIAFVNKGDAPDGGTRVPDNPDAGDDEYLSVYRMEDWFGNVLEQDFGISDPIIWRNILPSDPRIRYDQKEDRFIIAWFAATIDDHTTPNFGSTGYLLSVSASSDPTGEWYNYRITPKEHKNGIADYPALGYDQDGIYLNQNFFQKGEDDDFHRFQGGTFDVVDKSKVLNGEVLDPVYEFTKLTHHDGRLDNTVQPADAPGESAAYAVSSRFPRGNWLNIYEVTERGDGTPELERAVVPVPVYTNPIDGAPQPGTEDIIRMNDDRILDTTYDPSDGSLWATHNVTDGSARWYKLDPSASALLQNQTFKRSGQKTYYPAVGANGESTLLVYNTSSGDDYVSVEVAGRRPNTESGELEDYTLVQAGGQTYDYINAEEDDRGPQRLRWGDYNAVSVDPSDDSYWVVAMYANRLPARPTETGVWGTRIANVTFDF